MKLMTVTSAAALLAASSAFAADLAAYEPAPVAPVAAAPFDWTGFYVGGIGGLGTGDFEYDLGVVGGPSVLDGEISAGGAFGGVQVGYDWQTGAWVFGAVADIAITGIDASASISSGPDTLSAKSELEYLGTVRARVGYAFDRALVYGHGGLAYGRTEQTLSDGFAEISAKQNRTGWTIGAGIEYAVTDKVSVGTEYGYVDLGRKDVFNDGALRIGEDVRFHTVKAAVNFRF
ncbi:porin family protein [Aquamicrobium sp. LC103]|nr:porin family protein [Aquamicrobium sp. LC103]